MYNFIDIEAFWNAQSRLGHDTYTDGDWRLRDKERVLAFCYVLDGVSAPNSSRLLHITDAVKVESSKLCFQQRSFMK